MMVIFVKMTQEFYYIDKSADSEVEDIPLEVALQLLSRYNHKQHSRYEKPNKNDKSLFYRHIIEQGEIQGIVNNLDRERRIFIGKI